jgi:hypothetical protein
VVRPSAFCAQQVLVFPAVGPGIATAARQFVEVASTDTDQWRMTSSPWLLPLYQPLVPTVPSIEYVIEGGDADADAAKMRNNAVPTAAAVRRTALMAPSAG